MTDNKFRLITRADFDGVVCGALFNELEMIDGLGICGISLKRP